MSTLKTMPLYYLRYLLAGVRSAFIFLPVILPGTHLHGQKLSPKEYQIKAVFVFNLTQFVEWPEDAFPTKNSPLVIGVLGEDPFGSFLEETIRGEEAKGHPLVVERYQKVEEIKACHILFVNLAKPDQLKQVFNNLKAKPVLTVSDVNNFTRLGGMVRLFNENNKTRIGINLEATKNATLIVSSKLLKLAEISTTQDN